MDIKLKRSNIIALIICFSISTVCWGLEDTRWYIERFEKDFYKSYNLEQYLYEIATNSVYTVAGDSASEKILGYREESTNLLNKEKSSNIFVKNNNSRELYTNQLNFDLNTYMTKVKDYPYIVEINFKENTMYLHKGDKKVITSTKDYGNLGETRKEDVTTYIAIPDTETIKETNGEDLLYLRYRQYIGATKDTILFVGSKVLASIIFIGCMIFSILEYRKSKEKMKEISITSNIISIVFAIVISIISGYVYRSNIFYVPINSIIIFFLCFFSINLIRNTDINQMKDRDTWQKIKYAIILTGVLCIQFIIIYISILQYYNYQQIMPPYMLTIFLSIPLIINVVLFYFILKKLNKIQQIKNGIKEIRKGNLNHKILIKDDELLNEMVNDINEIGEVINVAVEDRLKSERMKTELITNVSHDLKTPLTAIINYVSLMKKEDIKPDHTKDYVNVLDKRSQRLKILIEDLFEASKIGSNDIELNLEKTDISQLIHQAIVEMDDDIQKSKLDFIINTPQNEVYIMADGKKTFRVFENLVSNITKYSLENTRVYVDLIEKEDNVSITFKNISKHQLNFDADEITERFTRGDLARNTEGSGLGLSIAKGFVKAQGGNFKVDIVGDMFIVIVAFNLIKD